jgi:hypothetical protein
MTIREEIRRLADGAIFSSGAVVESAILEGVKLVLEDCAKLCDEGVKWTPNFPPNVQRVSDETAAILAKAIRAMIRELLKELE